MVPRLSFACRWCGVGLALLFAFSAWRPAACTAGTFDVANEQEMMDLMIRVRATQFLQRATFGPTEAEIDAMVVEMKQKGVLRAARDFIDAQFALPTTSHVQTARQMVLDDGFALDADDVNINRYRDHAWWHIAMTAPDQLRQRIAFALSQIVVVSVDGDNFQNQDLSANGNPFWLGLSSYYDMLLENADDPYSEVLRDVTYSPVMGVYLSHLRNKKQSGDTYPDENYAREIMQLFSIGLYKLHPDGRFQINASGNQIPTYDNEVIKNFARLFTGLTYSGNTNINFGPAELMMPMTMLNSSHDTASKVLLDGQVLPGNANGVTDINAGLALLHSHPNVAPFISRLLIQRLVRSNPSRGYIERVSKVFNNNGLGVKGDMKAVVKAILLDRECWDSIQTRRLRNPLRVQVVAGGTEQSKMIEPMIMYAGFLRKFRAATNASTYPSGKFLITSMAYDWEQAPFRSPSVFNFYLPDFQPAGAIGSYTPSRDIPNGQVFAPEFQLFTSVVANRMANRYRWDINNGFAQYTPINNVTAGNRTWRLNLDFNAEQALAGSPAALVRHLDLKLCNGTMSEFQRAALTSAVTQETTNLTDRTRGAITSTVNSPAYMIIQ